jgi:hypothetical protein
MLLQRGGQGREGGDVAAGRERHDQQPGGVGMVWEEEAHSCCEEDQVLKGQGLSPLLLHPRLQGMCVRQRRIGVQVASLAARGLCSDSSVSQHTRVYELNEYLTFCMHRVQLF